MVQHVGCWILLALANELGLHDDAYRAFGQQHHDGLRIALDAVICALAIYQRCIEGVRRLATPTGPTLLRADRVPTASGVRKLFGRLLSETEIGGAILDARVATRFIAAAHADEGPAVFMWMVTCGDTTASRSCGKGGACKIAASCPARPTTMSTTRTVDRCFASQ
jgi:hypothetical protein